MAGRRTTKRLSKRVRVKNKTIQKSKKVYPKKRSIPNIKFCMISYAGNKEFAKLTQKTLKKEWGYSSTIYWGYKIDRDKYTHTNVIFEGIKDKMLSSMVKHNGPIYYIEDDIRFLEDPLKIPRKDVVWSVYRNGNLGNQERKGVVPIGLKPNKKPHDVITGSQAIYFSTKAVKSLKKHMLGRKRSIQIDSYFSEFIRQNPQLTFQQMVPSMGYEETHESLIDKNRDLQK
jgi:hypothetical protein